MGKVVTEVAVGDKDHEVNESLIKYPADRKLKKTRNIQRAFYHTNLISFLKLFSDLQQN